MPTSANYPKKPSDVRADVGIRAPILPLSQHALASGCLLDIAVGKLSGIKTAGPNGHRADDHANGRAPGVA